MDFKICESQEEVKNNLMNMDMSVNIPDINKLTLDIINVLEYMKRNDMKELRNTNFSEYEYRIENEFPDFVNCFYSIFKMLIAGDQKIENLQLMLKSLGSVNQNKMSFDDARNSVSKVINNQYVDPILNNKNVHKKRLKKHKIPKQVN